MKNKQDSEASRYDDAVAAMESAKAALLAAFGVPLNAWGCRVFPRTDYADTQAIGDVRSLREMRWTVTTDSDGIALLTVLHGDDRAEDWHVGKVISARYADGVGHVGIVVDSHYDYPIEAGRRTDFAVLTASMEVKP